MTEESNNNNNANPQKDNAVQKQSAHWLNAWHDPVANVKAYSSCVGLADLNTDGDNKLLIADLDRKLIVYKGNITININYFDNIYSRNSVNFGARIT